MTGDNIQAIYIYQDRLWLCSEEGVVQHSVVIPIKQIRLIKMCLNGTHSKVHTCGGRLVLRMVRNYELLYHSFSSTSLQNTPCKIRKKMEMNGKQQFMVCTADAKKGKYYKQNKLLWRLAENINNFLIKLYLHKSTECN